MSLITPGAAAQTAADTVRAGLTRSDRDVAGYAMLVSLLVTTIFTLVILFSLYFLGTVFRIIGMLERKRADGSVERARIVFFFTACLMLVCLIPITLSDLLTLPFLMKPVISYDLPHIIFNVAIRGLLIERRCLRGLKTQWLDHFF